MSVGIECPVCEANFLVKQVSPKTGIRCPECKRKFRYSEEVLAKNKSAEMTKQPADETTAETKAKPKSSLTESESVAALSTLASQAVAEQPDRCDKKSKWKTSAAETPRLQTPKPVHDSDPQQAASASGIALDQFSADANPSQLPGTSKLGTDKSKGEPEDPAAIQARSIATIQARKNAKARRQTNYATAAIALLSIATAILGFVLYRQLNLPADQLTTGQASAAETLRPNDINPASAPVQSDRLSDSSNDWPSTFANPESLPDEDEQTDEPPRVLADDLPKRKFEYFQKSELQKIWKRVRPRLISLNVRTDLGIMPSVGTIVDSRGWALTSNQLVSKWPDVSATASARNIDGYWADVDARKETDDKTNDSSAGQTLLNDVSKGIASAQPKRDQALLSLNTRFVVALDKFEFAARKRIVAGIYLAQVAPPSPTNPYGFEEVKVLERQDFDDLESEALEKAKALGIDDPLTTWIVTTKKANPVVGTPIFTRTNQMAGTYAFSTERHAYFVSSDRTPNLIAQAAQFPTEPGKLRQVDQARELLSPSHEMSRPSELLNKSGVACEAFGWIPADEDQYKQLQKFSRRFSTIVQFVRANRDDESDSVSLSILSDQIKRWQRSLSQSISDSYTLAPEKIFQLNAIAADKLAARRPKTNGDTYIPFVAELYSSGIDERTNQDMILMTVVADRAVIKVPVSGQARMKPGSLWLCFYRRPALLNRSMVKLNSGQTLPLYEDGNLLTVLGPIKKR